MKKSFGIKLTALFLAAALCGCSGRNIETEAKIENLIVADAVLDETPPVSKPDVEVEPVLEPLVYLSSTSVEQGGYILLRAENIDLSETLFTDFLGFERGFVPYKDGWYTVIPVNTAAEPGDYVLTFSKDGFEYSEDVTVLKREFEEQYLEVAQETLDETLEDKLARIEFDEKISPLYEIFSDTPLWNGEFICPLKVEYKITTSFGTFRTFSNGDTERHNAFDMAAKGGSPVYATNSGKVVFAGFLKLTGNTVIIDHGMGFMSWHYHMRKINVSAGDFIEKDTLIGEVGTTGLSTGNHLHFGLTAAGTFIDPLEMVGNEPDVDFWEESKE